MIGWLIGAAVVWALLGGGGVKTKEVGLVVGVKPTNCRLAYTQTKVGAGGAHAHRLSKHLDGEWHDMSSARVWRDMEKAAASPNGDEEYWFSPSVGRLDEHGGWQHWHYGVERGQMATVGTPGKMALTYGDVRAILRGEARQIRTVRELRWHPETDTTVTRYDHDHVFTLRRVCDFEVEK